MRILAVTLTMAVLALACGTAAAADLTGEWTAVDSWGAGTGHGNHGVFKGDTWRAEDEWTLRISEQSEDGRAFHGEFCSTKKCEDLVGAVRSDGTILMVDEDGYLEGRLLGKSMELCYMEADAGFRVVHCRIMERQ